MARGERQKRERKLRREQERMTREGWTQTAYRKPDGSYCWIQILPLNPKPSR